MSSLDYLLREHKLSQFDVLIETGIGNAKTLIRCADHFKRTYSVDINSEEVVQRIKGNIPSHCVTLYDTLSLDAIPQFISKLYYEEKVLWWLDTHEGFNLDPTIYSDSEYFRRFPLADELEMVYKNRSEVSTDVILCDDYLPHQNFPVVWNKIQEIVSKFEDSGWESRIIGDHTPKRALCLWKPGHFDESMIR